eukprot:jgi/Ulvmu1/10695/UM067_0021.1
MGHYLIADAILDFQCQDYCWLCRSRLDSSTASRAPGFLISEAPSKSPWRIGESTLTTHIGTYMWWSCCTGAGTCNSAGSLSDIGRHAEHRSAHMRCVAPPAAASPPRPPAPARCGTRAQTPPAAPEASGGTA